MTRVPIAERQRRISEGLRLAWRFRKMQTLDKFKIAVIAELVEAAEKVSGRAVMRGAQPTKLTLDKDRLRVAAIAGRKLLRSLEKETP